MRSVNSNESGLIEVSVFRFALSAIVIVLGSLHSSADTALSRIEQSLEENSGIKQESTEKVASTFYSAKPPLLFDVRTQEEFNVSHLEGAIQLDPDTDPAIFTEQYHSVLETESVVFYCSTGRRSTKLAQQVGKVLQKKGEQNLTPSNMKGGIFRWHNEERPLVDFKGKTDYVHPYSWFQERLLQRRDKVQYSRAH